MKECYVVKNFQFYAVHVVYVEQLNEAGLQWLKSVA
jgi:hypothetical protein